MTLAHASHSTRLLRLAGALVAAIALGSTALLYTEERRGDDARLPEVRDFIGRYFRTWSNQDMKGYDDCFHSDAVVQFLDARGLLETTPRRQFVAGQSEYHRTAPHRATEVPESVDIRFEGKLARAVVYWKLTAGPRLEYGYDHFTLLKQDGAWKIVNLVFYPVARKD